jgi:predicted Zn-dependent peptidase
MRKALLFFSAIFSLITVVSAQIPGKPTVTVLPNGLTLLVIEDLNSDSCTMLLHTDWLNELPEYPAGTLEMVLMMLDEKNSKTRNTEQFEKQLKQSKGKIKTSYRGIEGSSDTKHALALMSLIADIYAKPLFTQQQLDKNALLLSNNLANTEKTTPDLNQIHRNLIYGRGFANGQPLTPASINRVSLLNCQNLHKNAFIPNKSYLLVRGKVNPKEVNEWATLYFANWERWEKLDLASSGYTSGHPGGSPFAASNGRSLYYLTKPNPSSDQVTVSCWFVDIAKRGGLQDISALLLQEIVKQRGFTTEHLEKTNISTSQPTSIFSLYSPDKYRLLQFQTSGPDALVLMDSLLKSLNSATPVTAVELDNAKKVVLDQINAVINDPIALSYAHLYLVKNKASGDYLTNLQEQLKNITPNSLSRTIEGYIQYPGGRFVFTGSEANVTKQLATRKGAILTLLDAYGDPLKTVISPAFDSITADQIIANYINKVGTVQKLAGLRTMSRDIILTHKGGTLILHSELETKKRYVLATSIDDKIVSREVYQNGQVTSFTPGEDPEDVTSNYPILSKTSVFPLVELSFQSLNPTISLIGTKMIKDKKNYVIEYFFSSNAIITAYFDAETGLKTQETFNENGRQHMFEYNSYKDFDGLLLPSEVKSIGDGPSSIKLTLQKITANQALDESLFAK